MASTNVLEVAHQDARALLETGAPVFLLVNPPEFHGPHLPLRNDRLISEGIARDLHARLADEHRDWPFLVATALEVGCDVVPGPGAVETPFRTVRSLVEGAARALHRLGARRVVLMTFHGGPNHNHAIQAGVRLLERAGVQALAPLNLVTREMLSLEGQRFAAAWAHVEAPADRAALQEELRHDFHAGFFETSMTLHYAPASVSPVHRTLPPCPPVRPTRLLSWLARLARSLGSGELARELDYAAVGTGWYSIRPFPGYTGRPHLASAASGKVFAEAILDRYLVRARAVFGGTDRSPAPILGWLPAVSLGGRLGHPTVPPDQIVVAAPGQTS